VEATAVRFKNLLLVLAAALLAACGDNETAKRRLLETGNKYFDSGKYKEASIVYRKAIQRDPRYGEAYYRLGLTESKQGRYGEALRAYRRASELQPDNDQAHSNLGDLILSAYLSDPKKYKPLLAEFGDLSDRMLKRNPRSFDGLRMKGFQLVAEGKLAEAVEKFNQADSVKAGDGRVVLALVQAMAGSGQKDAAIGRAQQFLAKNKSYGPMYDFLYIQHVAAQRLPEAEAVLKSKVDNNPTQSVYYLELAAHYHRLGRAADSKATLERITADKKNFPNGYRVVGDFYFRIKDYESAHRAYEAGMAAQPEAKASYQKRLVEMLALQGRRSEAVALAEKLVEENKDDAEAEAIRASLRLRGGNREDLDQSIKELQAVISRMPDNPVVRYNLGEALAARGDLDQARVQLQEAVKLRGTYLPPRLSLARIHLAKGEFPPARQLADEVVAVSARDVMARLIRTSALMGEKDLAQARQELDIVFKISPDNPDGLYLKAMIDFSEGKVKDAEAAFRDLYGRTPPDPRGLLGLSEILMVTQRAGEAKALLQKELAAGKNERTTRLALANVLVRTEDYKGAEDQYKILLAKYPESEDLNLRMGEVYLRSKRYPEAISFFEKARKINPRNAVPLLKIAVIYELTNQKEKLRNIYEGILKIQPDNGVALNNIAYFMAESGTDLDQALTYAQRAKQQMPNNPDVADTLGWVYIKKNLSDDAIKIFRDLLSKKPEHVTWRYHLAIALVQKGDRLQAKKEIETAMKNKPSAEETQKLKELLGRIS
jgi:tetratricopeptide (TPR) repeat protein